METLVKDIKVKTESPSAKAENAAAKSSDRGPEIDELLRLKKERRIDAGRVPCPSCGVVVEMAINRCPFCDSDIAAETALARETTRRLRELSGELDAENAIRTRPEDEPARRGFFARLKYLFEGDPEPSLADVPSIDPHAKRLLGLLSPGDSLKVLEEDGPWLQVKTHSGEIGWVYSTVRKRQ